MVRRGSPVKTNNRPTRPMPVSIACLRPWNTNLCNTTISARSRPVERPPGRWGHIPVRRRRNISPLLANIWLQAGRVMRGCLDPTRRIPPYLISAAVDAPRIPPPVGIHAPRLPTLRPLQMCGRCRPSSTSSPPHIHNRRRPLPA